MKAHAMEQKETSIGYYLIGIGTGLHHLWTHMGFDLLSVNWIQGVQSLVTSGMTAGFSALCVKVFMMVWRQAVKWTTAFFKRKK
jgi:hypothetical protein